MPRSLSIGQYDAHLARQQADVRAFSEDESLVLDPKMEYSDIVGLSAEVAERLYRVKPTTIVRHRVITARVRKILIPLCSGCC